MPQTPERHKAYMKQLRKDNPTYDSSYYLKNRERILQADRERNRDTIRAKAREHYHRNPKQAKAQSIAKKLPMASKCELCGSNRALHRHHESYDEPTKFITICCSCHRKIHREKYGKQASVEVLTQ